MSESTLLKGSYETINNGILEKRFFTDKTINDNVIEANILKGGNLKQEIIIPIRIEQVYPKDSSWVLWTLIILLGINMIQWILNIFFKSKK